MADEEPPQPQSIAQRIAALKLKEGGPVPVPNGPPPSYNQATNNGHSNTAPARPRPPPPPRPSLPARPSAHGRAVSANVPTQNGSAYQSSGGIGNLPEDGEMDGEDAAAVRPALPPRTSTQSATSPADLHEDLQNRLRCPLGDPQLRPHWTAEEHPTTPCR